LKLSPFAKNDSASKDFTPSDWIKEMGFKLNNEKAVMYQNQLNLAKNLNQLQTSNRSSNGVSARSKNNSLQFD